MALSIAQSNRLSPRHAIASVEHRALKRSCARFNDCQALADRPYDHWSDAVQRTSVGEVRPARRSGRALDCVVFNYRLRCMAKAQEWLTSAATGREGVGQAPSLRVTPASRSNSCYRHAVISRVTRACDEARWQTHSGELAISADHPGGEPPMSLLNFLVTPVHLWNRMTHWREADTR